MMCRIVRSNKTGEVELEYSLVPTGDIQMYIVTSDGSKLDEREL